MNKPEFLSFKDWELLKEKYPKTIEEILVKIKSGYPVQYLIGNVYFYNSIINVSENVLIPRPETEYLVEKTIDYAKQKFNHKINIIDLGTGSGCIAIALKKELDSEVSAIDISKDALDLAKLNALENNVDINFYESDITKPL